MAAGDESKLTSIEFETSTCASLDAPGAPTAGNPRRPLAVLSVLVIVIGALAALLWANSRESEPADDIADTEAEDRASAENDEVAADETSIEPEPTSGSNDVVATPFGRDFSQVVLIGDELFALDESEAILPEIYRSPDGLEWTSIDVQMDRDSGSQVWFELDDIGGELVLIGELSGENTWHSSLDGEVWTELNLGREGQLSFFPVSSSDEAIAGFGWQGIVEPIIDERTTLELDEPVCFFFDSTGMGEVFALITCDGERVGSIDSSVIGGDDDAGDVLACLSALEASPRLASGFFVRRDGDTGENLNDQVFLDARVNIASEPQGLSDERIGILVEPSTAVDLAPCEGVVETGQKLDLIDGDFVVVVDVLEQRIESYPPPAEMDAVLASASELVGEFEGDFGTRLVVSFPTGLWALDPSTEQWEVIVEPSNTWGAGTPVVMVDDRVHVLHRDQLRTFELLQAEDGISATESSSTVVSADTREPLFVDGIVAASSELIIVNSEGQRWTIDNLMSR